MTQELAQQIHDAGFVKQAYAIGQEYWVQEAKTGKWFLAYITPDDFKDSYTFGDATIFEPTIEDLFNVLSDKFLSLEQIEFRKWIARGKDIDIDLSAIGEYPQEVLGRLFVELNKE